MAYSLPRLGLLAIPILGAVATVFFSCGGTSFLKPTQEISLEVKITNNSDYARLGEMSINYDSSEEKCGGNGGGTPTDKNFAVPPHSNVDMVLSDKCQGTYSGDMQVEKVVFHGAQHALYTETCDNTGCTHQCSPGCSGE